MRFATFNIYWLGDPQRAPRTEHHLQLLAQTIASLDADVIAFQEIVDIALLRSVLASAGERVGRAWSIDGPGLGTLASGGQPQNVVVAFDTKVCTPVASTRVSVPSGRNPVAVRLRLVGSESTLVFAGAHPQSGWPDFRDAGDSERRAAQVGALAAWLRGEAREIHPGLPGPEPGEAAVLAGDLNALASSPHPEDAGVVASLEPLRALPGWRWDEAREDERGGGRYSSWEDRVLIDHLLVSPALAERVTVPPTILAFDVGLAAGDRTRLVSDHRPVFLEVAME